MEEERPRCKQCGCWLGFDMGQEGDGDFSCHNKNCRVNTEDYRNNFDIQEWERINGASTLKAN